MAADEKAEAQEGKAVPPLEWSGADPRRRRRVSEGRCGGRRWSGGAAAETKQEVRCGAVRICFLFYFFRNFRI